MDQDRWAVIFFLIFKRMIPHWKLIGAALLLLTGLAACNRTYDPTPEHLEMIYPIQDGKQRIYHVVDTVFETSNSSLLESRTYYKREVTEGTEEDLLGREVSKLWLYESPDTLGTPDVPQFDWTFTELWTQYLGDEYAERTEGNTRYLPLRIPPYPKSTWNGNLYNNQTPQTYQYVNIDTTVTLNGATYENCVFVLQQEYYRPVQDSSSAIFIIEHAYEIYAPGIGKIVRYFKDFEMQSGVIDPESRIYMEVLVSHNYD